MDSINKSMFSVMSNGLAAHLSPGEQILVDGVCITRSSDGLNLSVSNLPGEVQLEYPVVAPMPPKRYYLHYQEDDGGGVVWFWTKQPWGGAHVAFATAADARRNMLELHGGDATQFVFEFSAHPTNWLNDVGQEFIREVYEAVGRDQLFAIIESMTPEIDLEAAVNKHLDATKLMERCFKKVFGFDPDPRSDTQHQLRSMVWGNAGYHAAMHMSLKGQPGQGQMIH